MKILIIGNIGTGKTVIGKKLSEILGFEFIQIDSIREKNMDGTISGEYFCLYNFLKNIEEKENVILEFTGAGCHKYAIKRALELSKSNCLVLVCRTKKFETIIERVKYKKYNYTSPFNINISNHIYFVENEINNDLKNKFWITDKIKVIEIYMDNTEDIQKNLNLLKDIVSF